MEFYKIEEEAKVFPGEYLLHVPSNKIVLCGAFKPTEGLIKYMEQGRVAEDKIENFNKIKNAHRRRRRRGCGGCKKR
jgi:hypothetical protein